MKIRKTLLAICLFIVALGLCGCTTLLPNDVLYSEPNSSIAPNDTGFMLNGPYPVERVVDGDTIVVTIERQSVKVRLIGIDTPESVATGDRAKDNCEEGKIASEFTKSLLTGQTVYLEYDVSVADKYGRTLAYVYLENKQTMVNDLLLERGYARTMTVQPNVKYISRFLETQNRAQQSGAGFWSDYFLETVSMSF